MSGLTAKEMEYEAKVEYEALASGAAPGYTSRQWSILLTKAQEKLVRECISQGWDRDETSRRIITKLLHSFEVKKKDIEEFSLYGWDNAYKIELYNDYFHMAGDVANGNVKVKPVEYDSIQANIDNPYRKPYEKEFWRLWFNKYAVIITDGTDLTSYSCICIKKPEPIITANLGEKNKAIEGETEKKDCKLDPIAHRDIVSRAAGLAEAYTNNQLGYELNMAEQQRKEGLR